MLVVDMLRLSLAVPPSFAATWAPLAALFVVVVCELSVVDLFELSVVERFELSVLDMFRLSVADDPPFAAT